MENLIIYSFLFLTALIVPAIYYRKVWANDITNLLFANRSLSLISSALSINSHWFWAIAIFVSPAVAYNWGIIGLLWFVIPNALSLIIVAMLSRKIRDLYPDGFSLTEYIKEKYGSRIVSFYYIMFSAIALAGILLGFTALFKFFSFIEISYAIDPIFIILIIGLITLMFTATGGIRTSILTGSIQTIFWLSFLTFVFFNLFSNDVQFLSSYGKNNLTTIFDFKFLTTFAIAFLITILVGATSHGMMWQKSFSMPKQNILPSYTIASVLFAVMVFMMGSLGLYASSQGLTIKTPDTSQLTTIQFLLGNTGLLIFGVLLIGQASTVIDSCLNYISSVATKEWFKTEDVKIARIVMILFFIFAWTLTWLKVEVWTIFMLMGVLRISMFMPLFSVVNNFKIDTNLVFYPSIVAVLGSLYMSWIARSEKLPIFDMYSAIFALGLGVLVTIYTLVSRNKFAKIVDTSSK
jgi:urea-proton symporter